MFKGPTRGGAGPGAQFGIGKATSIIEGTGQTISFPSEILTGIRVGLGNMVNLYIYAELLVPTNNTDIKWIDFMLQFQWRDAAQQRWPEEVVATDPIAGYSTLWEEMDTVPERDPVNVGTNNLQQRWRNWRLPNPADPENYAPWRRGLAPGNLVDAGMVIKTPALADYLTVRWFPVAMDASEDAVFRATENIQVGPVPGGYARTP